MDYVFFEAAFFAICFLVSVIKAGQLIIEEFREDYINEYVE
jgi:hypothetical protein